MLAEDPLTYNHKLMIPVIRTMTRMQSSAKVYLMVSSDMITDAMRDYALNEGCDLFWLMNGSAWRLENGALQPVARRTGSRRKRRTCAATNCWTARPACTRAGTARWWPTPWATMTCM